MSMYVRTEEGVLGKENSDLNGISALTPEDW